MEDEVIADIARRVAKTKRYTETAELMAKSMVEQGYSSAEILAKVMKHLNANKEYQKAVAENTKAYKQEIQDIIEKTVEKARQQGEELIAQAGNMAWNNDLSMWQQHGVDLKKPNTMSQLILAFQKQTVGALKNLTGSMGFKNTALGTTGVLDAYQKELDRALLKVATGLFSYDVAVDDCVRRLAESGLRSIDYASGRSYQLDTAARMCVRTGMSQLAGKIMEENLKNSGQDLVITSQHMGSRPEHAPWQNKVFSYSGKNKKYPDFVKETGYGTVEGLKGANCAHDFYPFWEGVSVIPDDLEEPEPKMINGKEYTYYQCNQQMRKMERGIRATKREIEAQRAIGGDVGQLKAKLTAQNKKYFDFCVSAGIRPKENRLRIIAGSSATRVKPRRKGVNGGKIKRTTEEYIKVANQYKKQLDDILSRESKWSGHIVVDNRKCDNINAYGAKEWDCNILLRDDVSDLTILHELLHSYSMSYYDEKYYLKYMNMEEATVEMLAREMYKGKITDGVYDELVETLYVINGRMELCKNDYEFALKIFNMDPAERYTWLHENVNKYMDNHGATARDYAEVFDFISKLGDL